MACKPAWRGRGLAQRGIQNSLCGFSKLLQFYLKSFPSCDILLYTGHKKHPAFLHRIVSFYRCDPRPSRGLQPVLLPCGMELTFIDATRAPHGDCNPRRAAVYAAYRPPDATRAPHGDCNSIRMADHICEVHRCDPRPSRGLQPKFYPLAIEWLSGCDPRPSRGLQRKH